MNRSEHDDEAPIGSVAELVGLLARGSTIRDEPEIDGLAVRTSRKYGSARLTLFLVEADA
jgi:hypothetical protein